MTDPALLVGLSALGLSGVGLASAAALRGWSEWLELKRLELARRGPSPARRIEIGALRERVKRLEAIASGVDLPGRL